MKAYFIEQADYQGWACDRLFISLDILSDEQRQANVNLFFNSIHKTVDHILVVTRNWRARLQQEFDRVLGYETLLYEDWDELKMALTSEFSGLSYWLGEQPGHWFTEKLTYPGSGGKQKTIAVADGLIHIMTHAVHHRGQISAICTRLGVPSPEMDFVFYRWR